MAKSNPYAGFEEGALKGILDYAGVKYPLDSSQKTLAGLVQDLEKAIGEVGFAQIIAHLNGVKVQAPSGATKSLNPGSSILWTTVPAIGGLRSDTWDPPTPLEYGRTLT